MSRAIERLRAPITNNKIDIFFRDVFGSKFDDIAEGEVTDTDTLVAYVKQIVMNTANETSLPTILADIDSALNLYSRDVIGNKEDSTAIGTVSDIGSIVSYIKQLVTLAIARDIAIGILDEYQDVPGVDNVLNAQMNEVLGNKEDSIATGAVTNTDTTIAYLKQLVTLAIARDLAIGVIDEYQDVPAANNTLNAQINEVIGNKSDSTSSGAVTSTDTMVAYIKQLVTACISILDDTSSSGVVLANSAITAAKIASSTITSDKIASGAISDAKIASNAITSSKISDNILTAAKFANDCLTSDKFADEALSNEHFDPDAGRKLTLGKMVNKTTSNLPQSTATAQFTISGGRVLVTSILGEVTTVIQTAANNMKLIANPTTGTSVDMCATLDISADEVGCLYGISGNLSDALIGINAGLVPAMERRGIILNSGTIDLECSASTTGATKWTLHYVPIDFGASVIHT